MTEFCIEELNKEENSSRCFKVIVLLFTVFVIVMKFGFDFSAFKFETRSYVYNLELKEERRKK